ncbi:hypothetical protein N8I74_17865 [Chitiniphilus purpureus]|uniref:Uncharacterized protein n=1 Tax=Chitiniphilus purpureus TaxID=2981137 RepID=A0ABY6DLB0_9NEIS|nr:hypothetical protein [Chitiniphilus sp. CD1]UXY15155.1 hypothetical protein N8I74_17865 [Chitiniphilus sp. CD1]
MDIEADYAMQKHSITSEKTNDVGQDIGIVEIPFNFKVIQLFCCNAKSAGTGIYVVRSWYGSEA